MMQIALVQVVKVVKQEHKTKYIKHEYQALGMIESYARDRVDVVINVTTNIDNDVSGKTSTTTTYH
jgi:hypothetical protein